MTKIIKRKKRLQLQREIGEIRIDYFTKKKKKKRMKGNLIDVFKIINGISNYRRHFFQYLS